MASLPDLPATPECPDRTHCRYCNEVIFWDDWCYVHVNGFADCRLLVFGGRPVLVTDEPLLKTAEHIARQHGSTLVIDPTLISRWPQHQTYAEPVEWDYYGTKPRTIGRDSD